MERKTRFLYAGFGLFFIGLFLFILRSPVSSSAPETDLWWMLPTLSLWTQGKGPVELGWFLFAPAPKLFEQPVLKFVLWFFSDFLRLPYRSLIVVDLWIHFANAFLVMQLSRVLRLGGRVGFLAGLVYLTFFGHFHAYFWPTAAQHMLAVFTILSILVLYLKTEELFAAGSGTARRFWWLTLAAGLLGSLQRSTLVAPAAVLAHLLLASSGPAQRPERFNRWWPLLALYPVYCIFSLSFVGDMVFNTGIYKFPLPAWAKAAGLVGGVLLGLGAVWLALSWVRRHPPRRSFGWILAGGLVLVVYAGLFLKDKREILLPYNALIPFTGLLGSFLEPIQNAFQMDSTQGYHVVPPRINAALLLFSLVLGWAFLKKTASRPAAVVLSVWYGVCLWYVLLHRHMISSFPIRIPSRYIVYFSPIFALVFCSVAVRVYDFLVRRLRLARPLREPLLLLLGAGLLLPNLMAIQLALFRGKMVNVYFVYDDLRASSLIRADLAARPAGPGPVSVKGVQEIDFHTVWSKYVPVGQIGLGSPRSVFEDAISHRPLILNQGISGGEGREYRVDEFGIRAGDGRLIGEFERKIEEGWRRLDDQDWEGSRAAFQAAVQARPFLLNYLLPGCGLSDARWLAGTRGLRDWTEEMHDKYRLWSVIPIGKWERVRGVMREELREYALGLYALSYLEKQAGRDAQAQVWMRQLYFLEPDPARLEPWLTASPQLRQRPGLRTQMGLLQDPQFYQSPLPWQKDDYGFGRFMARLMLGINVRSRWDLAQLPA